MYTPPEVLPAPELVREQLARKLREVHLLRGLLKLSERARKYERDANEEAGRPASGGEAPHAK